MAFVTTSLTLHLRADINTHIFKTFDAGGNHSGNPADGEFISVWDDEGDGVADVIAHFASGANGPTYKSSSSPMRLPCLYFGTSPIVITQTQTGGASKALSNFIAAAAYHMFVVFRINAAPGNNANPWQNPAPWGDGGGFVGMPIKTGPSALAFNWDGAARSVSTPVALATAYLGVIRHDGGTLFLDIFNSASRAALPLGSVSVAAGNTTTLTNAMDIGNQFGGQVFDGYIGEFAIHNAVLASGDRTDQINYFGQKWLGWPSAPAP